ncbi:hypothetical protein RP20_CCG023288 [Aedes albopictus]|nr:hypothetical protein RP20_CCG023288 [Aedes albopictus]
MFNTEYFKEPASFEQRDFVIKELVDTETNYLDALMALKYKFMQPLERALTKEVLRIIFPCIKELVDIHEKFLAKLKEAVAVDSKLKLSVVFLEFREPFLIYGDYCSSMTNATDMLREVCKKSSNVEQIVNSHEDFRGLERAKEAMVDVAQYSNEVKRDSEHLVVIQKVKFASTASFEQRDFVIKELVDTETNYLDALMALKYKFMQPLERALTKEVLRIIFPCIKELVDIHEKFLAKLKEAVAVDSKLKLSVVFLEFREPFLIYGDYCSSMTNATDMLREVCKKSSNVEQIVNQSQKEHSDGRLQLRDILSVPMQRILKYHLLLDKLVQETSPSHEDFRGLERAKEAMVDVAQYSNEVKRDSEHLVVIQKVKESILDLNLPNGNNLEQYGRLLLDGDLNIKAHEDQKTKHRYAFVFEKVMILVKNSNTKIGEGQYVFREAHNLQDYRVEICHSRRTLGRDGRLKYSLLLARKTQSTAFTLYMKTEEERDKWKRAFDIAMEVIDPIGCRNTDHRFNVCTFDAPIICRHCSKFLKGKIHQGYRCKSCEIVVHKGCISSTGRCKQNQSPPPVCDRLLSEFNWFVGAMDRDTATNKLEKKKVGTYLLRVRPQGASNSYETIYALSLKTDNKIIKHMKIYQKQENFSVLYYLSTRRHFKTIVELVSFYERNDLGENFAGLNQSLQWPFKEVIATALYDFSPNEPNQLPLRQGCQVIVIGKEGDSKGWWRGKTLEKVGFFPKEYVRENQTISDDQ